jgi:hypothetical protein
MMNWQLLITVVIIAGAVGYAAWRCYDNFREGGDPCKNCELKEKCQKNCEKTQHHTCHCK